MRGIRLLSFFWGIKLKLVINQAACCMSDWDLGVCLQYECRRKQIHKPDVLNSWIDLRCTYRVCSCFLFLCFYTLALTCLHSSAVL